MKLLKRIMYFLEFIAYYIYLLIETNLKVARDVLKRQPSIHPGFVRIDLEAETDTELLLLTCSLTMTPGSTVVDMTDDRKYLFIHEMYAQDPNDVRMWVRKHYEERILRITR